ncbi:MAG: glycosyltransferase family 1 protein [bacterium]|nr:glycosyltransferase family 1 protein [bacterium]
MRILIDLRVLTRPQFSGITEYTKSLVNHLLSADKKNEYILFYNGFQKAPLPEKWVNNPQIKVINSSIPNRLWSFSNKIFNLPKIDKKIKADVFFSPHFNILSLANPRKRIFTFHDLSFIHYPNFFSNRDNFWHWLQNYKRQAQTAGHLIAVSEFTRQDLIDNLFISPERITKIYSGINPIYKKLSPEDKGLKEFEQSHNLEKPFLFYLGMIEPRKNIPAIIRAFNILKTDKNFKDLKLVIAGSNGWLYDKIFKEAKKSKFQDEIVFWGPATPAEALCLYNLAEVFVYPSFFEGFGFPPLEAQACGLPVITSNRSSLPEVMGDSALMVDPWRIDDLATAIEKILANEHFRKNLREAGFLNIKKFNWDKTARETIEVFSKLGY